MIIILLLMLCIGSCTSTVSFVQNKGTSTDMIDTAQTADVDPSIEPKLF